jgi:regulator of replication initiation timing
MLKKKVVELIEQVDEFKFNAEVMTEKAERLARENQELKAYVEYKAVQQHQRNPSERVVFFYWI